MLKLKSCIFWDLTPCSLYKYTDVSEEHNVSIFRVRVYAKHVYSKKQSAGTVHILIYSWYQLPHFQYQVTCILFEVST
jgi:hypothetical protein